MSSLATKNSEPATNNVVFYVIIKLSYVRVALQKAIDEGSDEGLVSGHFAESELRTKYPQVLLNSLGVEIEDLTKPDVRTLVDATQWGGGAPTNIFFLQCIQQDRVLRMPFVLRIA